MVAQVHSQQWPQCATLAAVLPAGIWGGCRIMGVSDNHVPTAAEIRAVRALYSELEAACPGRKHKARVIARQLGAPFELVNQIVAPLRGPKPGSVHRRKRRRRDRAAAQRSG